MRIRHQLDMMGSSATNASPASVGKTMVAAREKSTTALTVSATCPIWYDALIVAYHSPHWIQSSALKMPSAIGKAMVMTGFSVVEMLRQSASPPRERTAGVT